MTLLTASGDHRPPVVAFVNNMPEAAFEDTERQFLGLVAAATGAVAGEVRRYVLPGIHPGGSGRTALRSRDLDLDHLWDHPPDALVVTGAEPRACDLEGEDYWEPLARLLTWSEQAVGVALLSCLAAHAALLLFHGIRRRPLPRKLSGVYPNDVIAGHPLTAGLPAVLDVPHSWLNDIPVDALDAAGATVLLRSPQAGWTAAATTGGSCRYLLVQGHPEYAPDTLLREYRRDVRRFLRGERPDYPDLPVHYLGPAATAVAARFAEQVRRRGTAARADMEFPFDTAAADLPQPWRAPAETLMRNWLREAGARRRSGTSAG